MEQEKKPEHTCHYDSFDRYVCTRCEIEEQERRQREDAYFEYLQKKKSATDRFLKALTEEQMAALKRSRAPCLKELHRQLGEILEYRGDFPS